MVRYTLLPTLRRFTSNWITSQTKIDASSSITARADDRDDDDGDGGGGDDDVREAGIHVSEKGDAASITAACIPIHITGRRKRMGRKEASAKMTSSCSIGRNGSTTSQTSSVPDETDHKELVNGCTERLVIKTGSMRKKKTMRKKFFVLLKEVDGSVWLDYFDSAKKYEASDRSRSKKTISISDSFYISQRDAGSDQNKQHMIDIFTNEICFTLVLENEADLKDWMEELRKQRTESLSRRGKRTSQDQEEQEYSQVWQVFIAKKGLGLPPHSITGMHRICLTTKMIHMFKVESSADPSSVRPLEFPLNSIRKCARTGDFFSLEVGRGSTIGAGELLMETEDAATARHMHETIRKVMWQPSDTSSSHSGHRPRSSSSSDGTRGRRSTLGHIHTPTGLSGQVHGLTHSISAQNTPLPAATAASPNASGTTPHLTSDTSIYTDETAVMSMSSSFRDRCDSEPANQNPAPRSRCTSEGTSQLHYTTVSVMNRPNSGRLQSSSPPSTSLYHHHNHPNSGAVSPTSVSCSTESVGSLCHSDAYSETDYGPHYTSAGKSGLLFTHREVSCSIPSQPSILEQEGEDSAETYIVMDMSNQKEQEFSFASEKSDQQYVLMSPTSGSSPATSTSLMSPTLEADTYVDMGPSVPQSNESGYLSMVMAAPTVLPTSTSNSGHMDDGYLMMAPHSRSASITTAVTAAKDHHHHHRPRHHHQHRSYQDSPPEPPRESLEKLAQEFPLLPVKSFFSPAEEPADLIKPVRAYSMGSRPKPHHLLLKDSDLSQSNWYARDSTPESEDAASGSSKDTACGLSRVRAYSVGSRMTSGPHTPFRGSQSLRKRAVTQDSVISSSSASDVIPEVSHETTSPSGS